MRAFSDIERFALHPWKANGKGDLAYELMFVRPGAGRSRGPGRGHKGLKTRGLRSWRVGRNTANRSTGGHQLGGFAAPAAIGCWDHGREAGQVPERGRPT